MAIDQKNQALTPSAQDATRDESARRCLRVLIADDSQFNIHSFRKVLSNISPKYTLDVTSCLQGDQVVKILKSLKPNEPQFDLVFLDLEMPPGINGFQTL